MADTRIVNTSFWKDPYVVDLDPTEKLLFLYFLTNPRTNLAGVYEISVREAAFDTGIDKDMITKIMARFAVDNKMTYEKSWLILHNFLKHQRLNPSMIRNVEKILDDLPEWLKKSLTAIQKDGNRLGLKVYPQGQAVDRLGTGLKKNSLKESKVNKSKVNQKGAESNKFDRKNYAIGVRRDEELAEKAKQASGRKASSVKSGYEIAKERAQEIKDRKVNSK